MDSLQDCCSGVRHLMPDDMHESCVNHIEEDGSWRGGSLR